MAAIFFITFTLLYIFPTIKVDRSISTRKTKQNIMFVYFFFAQVFSWWSHKFNSLALNSQDFHSKEFNISPSFYSYPAELTY